MSSENLETVQSQYEAGKVAFERGEYRQSVQCLEAASALVEPTSRLGGEVQIWLVTAYEAMGMRSEAIALCRQVSRHPDYATRKQGSRLLYILEAPRLVTRPEWLTQIPDLSNIQDGRDTMARATSVVSTSKRSVPAEPPKFQLEPADLSQVNTRDNRFIWVALAATILVLVGLWWAM